MTAPVLGRANPGAAESEARREAAHAELLRAVARCGGRVPCRTGDTLPVSDWTSDDDGAQTLAAQACRGCPIFVECRRYGIAFPKESGVYGGLTDKQRRNAARTTLKENHA